MGEPFDQERLVATAVEATGLDDFGEDTWQEGLEILLDSLATEADLNDIGRVLVETEVVEYLTRRAQILDWRSAHPEVADGAIERPVVIVGQPRTGTTILYDLLAQDPAMRAPLSWEVDHPVPPPRTETFRTDERIALSQATCDMADVVIPGFTDHHPLGAELAQECVRITGSDFRSMIFPTQHHAPTYNRWLLHVADMAPAYRWHRIYLQHLQSEHMANRWLLKSPAHLWHLDALMAEYPDAIVIQTHRDPLKVIASVSALAAHLRRMGSDNPTVEQAAAQLEDDIFVGLERSLEARDNGIVPEDQLIDVRFTEFMADPFATIGAIYDRMGLKLTAEAEDRMRTFLAEHPGDGGGAGTRYTWAATGLDAEQLRERAKEYQERLGVEAEPVW